MIINCLVFCRGDCYLNECRLLRFYPCFYMAWQFNSRNGPVKAMFATCALTAAVAFEILCLWSYALCETWCHWRKQSWKPFSGIPCSNVFTVNKMVQLNATICRHLFTAKSLYMFRASEHPSSGALKTVTATSGIVHNTGTATSFQRVRLRTRNHEL